MDRLLKKPYLVWTGALALSLVLSLLLFLLMPPSKTRRVLFFPNAGSSVLTGETRYLLNRRDPERKVEAVVEALILGPVNVRHLRVFPRQTEIRSILYRDTTLYLDLGTQVLFEEREVPLSTHEMIAAVKKNLVYNFPYLKEIIVTVNGQLPDQPYYTLKSVRSRS